MSSVTVVECKILSRMSENLRLFGNDRSVENAKALFDAFFEFACSEDVDTEALRSFATNSSNVNIVSDIIADLATYFHILMADLNNAYEDEGYKEYKLYELCCIRSGLETFIELFGARLQDSYESNLYDDWYKVTLDLPEFDKKLATKLKEFPLLNERYIPKDILPTHWWFQHPTEW